MISLSLRTQTDSVNIGSTNVNQIKFDTGLSTRSVINETTMVREYKGLIMLFTRRN